MVLGMYKAPAKVISMSSTSDLSHSVQASTINPRAPLDAVNMSAFDLPPPLAFPLLSAAQTGSCNTDLPSDSTLTRCVGTRAQAQDIACSRQRSCIASKQHGNFASIRT